MKSYIFISLITTFFLSYSTLYAQEHPFVGMWVEIKEDRNEEKLQKRCKDVDEGIYNHILFVEDGTTQYLMFNRVIWDAIKKMQRLRNTKFEIVDLSYGSGLLTDELQYHTEKRELWSISEDKQTLFQVSLRDDSSAYVGEYLLCR